MKRSLWFVLSAWILLTAIAYSMGYIIGHRATETSPSAESNRTGRTPSLLRSDTDLSLNNIKSDPNAETQILITQVLENERSELLAQLISTQDPASQLEQVRELLGMASASPYVKDWLLAQDQETRERLMPTLISTWYAEDKEGLETAIAATQDPDEAERMRTLLFAELPTTEKLARLDELSEVNQAKLIHEQSDTLSETAPEQTLNALTDLPASNERYKAIAQFVSEWTQRDPVRTAEAAEQIEDMPTAETALYETAFHWSRIDSYQASQWVNNLPIGPRRDAAISGLANELASAQPDMAVTWAGNIQDATLRAETLERSFRSWLEKDPVGAQQAFSLPLSDSDRALLNDVASETTNTP